MTTDLLSHLPSPYRLVVLGCCILLLAILTGFILRELARKDVVIRLKGFVWDRQCACQHILITGATGVGKTRSAVIPILLEFFRNQPSFGGLCVDIKGVLHEQIIAAADHFHRANDVLLLEIRPATADQDWRPKHRFNLVGDRSIAFATHAQCVVDTAVALGNRHEQSFFRSAAQIHIAKALEALHDAGLPVTLENAHNLLVNPQDTYTAVQRIKSGELAEHFRLYLAQPPEQLAGITGTVRNYLHYFIQPEIAEVFCRDSTFSLRDLDQGKIVCIGLPQRYQTERRFVGTFLKHLFYLHALGRYDRPAAERSQLNLLLLLVDECQHFVTTSEHGLSDHSVIDIIREAGVSVVAATQSTTSLVPALGAQEAKVFTLNLRNRFIFTAADDADATASADFIGKRRGRERTTSWSAGRVHQSIRFVDEHKVKPHLLTHLRKHECIVVHCEKGFRRTVLPPREADGSVSPWYRSHWLHL
jgi:type IV secretory pathway TraG/TraD family ATPase VirD4